MEPEGTSSESRSRQLELPVGESRYPEAVAGAGTGYENVGAGSLEQPAARQPRQLARGHFQAARGNGRSRTGCKAARARNTGQLVARVGVGSPGVASRDSKTRQSEAVVEARTSGKV
ncbi:hypothetical protein chiPu_0000103 [Chiloscyllium punctatum]|uniref:Uncharacterized protein n=1 Tax=Chiloscyllium punctatum TaxID=137246 RepID=A0A401RS18_CHIPU|nr:hypothetical protein [Chiloscyllium punctatum]